MAHALKHRFGRSLALLVALVVCASPALARAQSDDDDDAPAQRPTESAPAPEAPVAPAAKPRTVAPQVSSGAEGRPADESRGDGDAPTRQRAAAVSAEQGYLEGRAEAESPNEAIHTVEKKAYTAANRFELTVYPGALQLNSKFTNSDGFGLAIGYAIQENFALQLLGFYNYIGGWSPLTGQLFDIHARPLAADQLILQGGGIAAFEVAPIYGKFAFYEGALAQFRFVVNAGAGVGSTEVQLSGSTSKYTTSDTSYGSTGLRFLGNLGAGFRILLGERLALRLEVRDILFTARVDSINGCNAKDLAILGSTTAGVSSSCSTGNFSGGTTVAAVNQQSTARSVASSLLGDNSSDVVNDIVFFGGLSFLF